MIEQSIRIDEERKNWGRKAIKVDVTSPAIMAFIKPVKDATKKLNIDLGLSTYILPKYITASLQGKEKEREEAQKGTIIKSPIVMSSLSALANLGKGIELENMVKKVRESPIVMSYSSLAKWIKRLSSTSYDLEIDIIKGESILVQYVQKMRQSFERSLLLSSLWAGLALTLALLLLVVIVGIR